MVLSGLSKPLLINRFPWNLLLGRGLLSYLKELSKKIKEDDIEVMIGNSKITDYSLTKVNNTDYNIKINSNLVIWNKFHFNYAKFSEYDNDVYYWKSWY